MAHQYEIEHLILHFDYTYYEYKTSTNNLINPAIEYYIPGTNVFFATGRFYSKNSINITSSANSFSFGATIKNSTYIITKSSGSELISEQNKREINSKTFIYRHKHNSTLSSNWCLGATNTKEYSETLYSAGITWDF